MILEQSNTDVWIVYYKLPSEPAIYSETTTDLPGTYARLEAAGFIVLGDEPPS